MVLQNKYKRAVSARYKQASGSAAASASRSPSPSPAPSSYKLDPTFPTSSPPLPALSQDDPAGPSFRRRKVDSNAGRYANSSPSDSSDVDEEEKAEQVRTRDLRAAELAAFSVKQRLALNVLSPPVSLDTSDVETTFSHLLHHSLQPRYLRSRTPPTVDVELLRVEATKAEASRAIRTRYQHLQRSPDGDGPADVDRLLDELPDQSNSGFDVSAPSGASTPRAGEPAKRAQLHLDFVLGLQ